MVTRVGINGFGRIGRLVLRAALEAGRDDLEFVAINDLGSADINAHLLKFDTVHGILPMEVAVDGDRMKVGNFDLKVLFERNPEDLGWGDLGVDIVVESTGIFASKEAASRHLTAGAKRVLVSAPATNADKTIVYGVNHDQLTTEDVVVSNASCTTNCLAPIAKVLNDTFGIERGYMTTIHSYTGDQPSVDTMHKDPYRARTAAQNMIPTTTGAARAVGLVMPELAGKLDGASVRVPTANVSLVDLTFTPGRDASVEAINDALKSAAAGALKGVLECNELPLVSSDFNHNPASSTADLPSTQSMDGKFARMVSWYDNEWGFSNRMLDTAATMGGLI